MLVRSTKGEENVWRRKATPLCARTKQSRHEQDTRHQPLSLRRHLLRLTGRLGILRSPTPDRARAACDDEAACRTTEIASTFPCIVTLPPLLGASKAYGAGGGSLRPASVGGPPCKPSLSLTMTAIS